MMSDLKRNIHQFTRNMSRTTTISNKNTILFLLMALLMSGTMNAQTGQQSHAIPEGRKKVAVVLSGGGAKGMAHIGVLKVLERAGIPIDIITGTSMGSIIGGLYSIGYNANALDSIVRMQDWSYVISDKENLRNQTLNDYRKQYTYVYSTDLTVGKDPTAGGLIKGKNLSELFQHLCTGYTDSIDFTHQLPISYACVATNIMDNSEIVFHSGHLPQAMRASMAIPAVFSPVRIGDMILVDGGLRNNYPADVAREMGADIIIGVTLSGKQKTAEEISSTMSIIGRIIDVICVNKYDENIAISDLHMNVDPRSFSAASFTTEAIDSLIRYGEEEAMLHWDEIIALKKQIGVEESFRPTILQPLRPKVMTERHRVTGFTFENMSPQAEKFLRQKFHLQKIDSIDAELEQQLTTSIRLDLFYQTAECRLVPKGDGVHVILSAGERKLLRIHAGARFDTEEYAAVQLGLEIPLKTAIPVSTDFTLRLGKRIMASGDLTIHPRNFTRPTFSYTFYRNDMDVNIHGERDYSIIYNHSKTEFYPVNFYMRHFNMRMGIRWDYMHYRNQLGGGTATGINLKNEHYFSYHTRLDYNNEDNWNFPTRGVRVKTEYAYLTDNFTHLDGKVGMSDINGNIRISFPLNNSLTLQPMIYGRFLFGSSVPFVYGNVIGGDTFGHYIEQQMPFSGIGYMEYVDHHFLAVQLQGQQMISQKLYALAQLTIAKQSNQFGELLDHRTLAGGQVGVFYNSILGPAGITFGYSNHTKKAHLFLNLGYNF